MRSCSFILADLMVALGRDPYHAACTEMWLMVMIIAPALVLAPYLLCCWDEYMRTENARRRAARKRIYERARNHEWILFAAAKIAVRHCRKAPAAADCTAMLAASSEKRRQTVLIS